MAKLYNFTRLVNKYSNKLLLKTIAGSGYIDGHYVEGIEMQTNIKGAVVPYSTSKIYQSGGNIKTSDMQLYTLEPLDIHLDNTRIVYKNKTYKVEEDTDYTMFSDVHIYRLIYVENLT